MNLSSRFDFVRNGLNVRRFHQHTTHEVNTVGAHSAGVALMCLLINPRCRKEVLAGALTHDLGEWVTGDIPAPTKRMISDAARDEIADVEYQVLTDFEFNYELSADEITLIKLGDYFDGLSFCIEEARRGNRTLLSVAGVYITYLLPFMQERAYGHPWSMNAFDLFNRIHDQYKKEISR